MVSELCPGSLIDGRFQVVRSIGVGSVACVYEAVDVSTGRRYAIKTWHARVIASEATAGLLVQEARLASGLVSMNAGRIEGAGRLANGLPYVVMELVGGLTLRGVIQRFGPRMDAERALCLVDQVAQAVHEAHSKGFVHFDLKPENIFVLPTDHGELAKVVDFGFSKVLANDHGAAVTQPGMTIGTPQYMPIEQLRRSKDIDGRVDVYALGVVLYEMLAGVRPYDGANYGEVSVKIATTGALSVAMYRQDLPHGLANVVDRAIARNRQDRVASMAHLRSELASYWSGSVMKLPKTTGQQPAMHVSGSYPVQACPQPAMHVSGSFPTQQGNPRLTVSKTIPMADESGQTAARPDTGQVMAAPMPAQMAAPMAAPMVSAAPAARLASVEGAEPTLVSASDDYTSDHATGPSMPSAICVTPTVQMRVQERRTTGTPGVVGIVVVVLAVCALVLVVVLVGIVLVLVSLQ